MAAVEVVLNDDGFTVVWVEWGDTPRTDLVTKKVYLPTPPYNLNDEQWLEFLAYVYHEFGHHHSSQDNYKQWRIDNECCDRLKVALNAVVSDIHLEWEVSKLGKGVRDVLSRN